MMSKKVCPVQEINVQCYNADLICKLRFRNVTAGCNHVACLQTLRSVIFALLKKRSQDQGHTLEYFMNSKSLRGDFDISQGGHLNLWIVWKSHPYLTCNSIVLRCAAMRLALVCMNDVQQNPFPLCAALRLTVACMTHVAWNTISLRCASLRLTVACMTMSEHDIISARHMCNKRHALSCNHSVSETCKRR